MTHPSRSNHIETNSPGAIAKGPVYGHLIKTKFLLFINNWLWREKQFYNFSKIQAPILATIDFYYLFTITYKIVIQNTNSSQNPCFPPRQHPSGPVSARSGATIAGVARALIEGWHLALALSVVWMTSGTTGLVARESLTVCPEIA
jgi:hypothetical protein